MREVITRDLKDIIVHCDGCHFTLLVPQQAPEASVASQFLSPSGYLTHLLSAAQAAGHIVQSHSVRVDPAQRFSTSGVVNHLVKGSKL